MCDFSLDADQKLGMSVDALRREFEQRVRVVPTSSATLLFENGKDVAQSREEIMKVHRWIFLNKLFSRANTPKFFPHGDLNQFLQFVSVEPGSRDSELSPRQCQFMTKMVDFFIKNPAALVEVCKNAKHDMKDTKFKLFCRSCVPALFGFYSSREHLLIMRPFLAELVKLKQKDIVFAILEPFFCNATTFRYVESLANWLFADFCPFIMQGKNDAMYKKILTEFRARVFGDMKLLPKEHLMVLRGLVQYGMRKQDVFNFFVESFLRPQILFFFCGSPFIAESGHIEKLLQNMKRVSDSELLPLFSGQSFLDVPSMFFEFDLLYVFFLITPRDVEILYKMSKGIEFPSVLKMTMSPAFVQKQCFVPHWLKLYPKNLDIKSLRLEPVSLVFNNNPSKITTMDIPHFRKRFLTLKKLAVERNTNPISLLESTTFVGNSQFENEQALDFNDMCDNCRMKMFTSGGMCELCRVCSKKRKVTFTEFALKEALAELESESQVFEKFLGYFMHYRALQEFSGIVHRLYELVLSQFCEAFSNALKIPDNLERVQRILNTPLTKQITFAIYFYKPFVPLNEQWIPVVRMLCHHWKSVARAELTKYSWKDVVTEEYPKGTQKRLISQLNRIVQQISVLERIAPPRRYFLLSKCIKELDIVSKALGKWNQLVGCTLKSSGFGGIWTYLLCATLLMKRNEFHTVCTADELARWCEFEKIMLDIIERNEKLSEIYETLQDDVLMEVSAL